MARYSLLLIASLPEVGRRAHFVSFSCMVRASQGSGCLLIVLYCHKRIPHPLQINQLRAIPQLPRATLAFTVPPSSCRAVCKTYLKGETTTVNLSTATKAHAIAAQSPAQLAQAQTANLTTWEIFQGSWEFICRSCRGSVLQGLAN